MSSGWLLRPGLSTCNACLGRHLDAWVWRAPHAGNIYCRPCALAVFHVQPPPLLDWPGWSRFKPLEHNPVHNRPAGGLR
jgi:hypothetical protein